MVGAISDGGSGKPIASSPLLSATAGATTNYQSRAAATAIPNDAANSAISASSRSSSSIGSAGQHHKTTAMQTYIHLLKGFVGVGCLSLPWAISILGYVGGFVSIFVLSAWTSYNCKYQQL